MKKILTSIFVLGLAFSLGACTPGGQSQSQSQTPSEEEKILEDKNSYAWAIHGQHLLKDGTPNGWNGKDNELYEASKMTATSIADVKKIDAEVGAALAQEKVKYLYKYEGLILGTNDSGWKTKFRMGEDLYNANGSYCFKAVKLSYDAEEEVYAEEQWIPHDHDGHTKALTPDTLWLSPNFAEEPDEDGFSWDYNPVAKAAGVYTVIFAELDEAVSATQANYAAALIKTEAKEGIEFEKIDDQPVGPFVPADHTYGLIGTFNSWNADLAMSAGPVTDSWVASVELAAADQFKVRADADWDAGNWGFEALDTEGSVAGLEDVGGNISVVEGGTYSVTISFVGEVATIVVSRVL